MHQTNGLKFIRGYDLCAHVGKEYHKLISNVAVFNDNYTEKS